MGVALPEVFQSRLPGGAAPQSMASRPSYHWVGRHVLPDRSDVQAGNGDAFAPQPVGGADHEGGFAHLARVEDIAELGVAERLKSSASAWRTT